MKVEKINENKIRITLTLEELSKRKISLRDIEKNSSMAKDLFVNLIEESNLEEDFKLDGSQFFVEASSDNNNLFIVTITIIDNIPDLNKYSLVENTNYNDSITKGKKRNIYKKPTSYSVDSYIYLFNSLDDLLDMCTIAKKEKMFFGKNSLYKYDDYYVLIFSKYSIKNQKFIKTFILLSEYCNNYYSYDMFSVSIKEKSKLIIENNALQKLSKI